MVFRVFGSYLIYLAQNNKWRTIGGLPSLFTCLLVQLQPFPLLNTKKKIQNNPKQTTYPLKTNVHIHILNSDTNDYSFYTISTHAHAHAHTHIGIVCRKKYIEMLAWLFFVLFCFLAATLKCYSCASVDRPEDCQTTIECPSKDHVGKNSRLYSILI